MANRTQTKSKIIKNDIKYKDFEEMFSRFVKESDYSKERRLEDVKIIRSIYSDNFEPSIPVILNMVIVLMKGDIKNGESIATKVASLKDELYRGNTNISNTAKEKFNDLYEQINLEIGRYNIMSQMSERSILIDDKDKGVISSLIKDNIDNKIKDFKDAAEESKKNSLFVQKEIKRMDDKLEKNSMSSITSLTIFSAVILALTGGISFASGVFGGINKASKLRLIFTIAMVGLVLFNLIYMLLFVVAKMTYRNIEFECNFYNPVEGICKCGKGYCSKNRHKSSLICIVIKKYTYWIVPNLILIGIMYYTGFFYFINNASYFGVEYLTDTIKMNVFLLPVYMALFFFLINILCNIFQVLFTYRRNKIMVLEKYISIEEENKWQITFKNVINNMFKSIINDESSGGIEGLILKGNNYRGIKKYVRKEAIKKTVSIKEQKYTTVMEDLYNRIKLIWYFKQVKKTINKKKNKKKNILEEIIEFIKKYGIYIITLIYISTMIISYLLK